MVKVVCLGGFCAAALVAALPPRTSTNLHQPAFTDIH